VKREVFDVYRDLEWREEWEQGVAEHVQAMCPGLMARTDAQRSFDALKRVFDAAASSPGGGVDAVVNIVIDEATFEHHQEQALGGDPEPILPILPKQAAVRRCEDGRGTVIDPRADVVAQDAFVAGVRSPRSRGHRGSGRGAG